MTWVIVVIGYLLGSIPTGHIAGRLIAGKDIRRMGDANTGAANVFRELSRTTGILVGLADAAKGALAVLLAQTAMLPQTMVLLTGLVAVLGHNFPVFLGFRGGKGVSTSIGVLLVVYTVPSLIMALPCVAALWLTRNVTPAMAVFYVPLSILGWWLGLPAWVDRVQSGAACYGGPDAPGQITIPVPPPDTLKPAYIFIAVKSAKRRPFRSLRKCRFQFWAD
jgi:acyl phosphate:glycerol-3-phosphate acyltransferase